MQCKTMRRNVIINCAAAQSQLAVAFLFHINRIEIKIFTLISCSAHAMYIVICYTESQTLQTTTKSYRMQHAAAAAALCKRERNYFYNMHKMRIYATHLTSSSTSCNIDCGRQWRPTLLLGVAVAIHRK